MVIPLLDAIAIQGKFANYVVEREADYHFTVKNNQPTLRQDIALFFENRQANAEKVLKTNREHWSIENSCHYVIDWNYNEDRCRIRSGHGPEKITRLRRFGVGLIKSKGDVCVAQKMRE